MSARAGCTDPGLGERLSDRLGSALEEELERHLDGCLACQVEAAAFARFRDSTAPLPDRLRSRLERLLHPGPRSERPGRGA